MAAPCALLRALAAVLLALLPLLPLLARPAQAMSPYYAALRAAYPPDLSMGLLLGAACAGGGPEADGVACVLPACAAHSDPEPPGDQLDCGCGEPPPRDMLVLQLGDSPDCSLGSDSFVSDSSASEEVVVVKKKCGCDSSSSSSSKEVRVVKCGCRDSSSSSSEDEREPVPCCVCGCSPEPAPPCAHEHPDSLVVFVDDCPQNEPRDGRVIRGPCGEDVVFVHDKDFACPRHPDVTDCGCAGGLVSREEDKVVFVLDRGNAKELIKDEVVFVEDCGSFDDSSSSSSSSSCSSSSSSSSSSSGSSSEEVNQRIRTVHVPGCGCKNCRQRVRTK